MYCKHCGNELSDDAEYCSNCGKPVNDTTPVENTNEVDEDLINFSMERFHGNQAEAMRYLMKEKGFKFLDATNFVNDVVKKEKEQKEQAKETAKNNSFKTHSKFRCPRCKSTNLEIIDNGRRGFSFGKTVVGGLTVGPLGALFGFTGKKGKMEVLCRDCGNRFKKK